MTASWCRRQRLLWDEAGYRIIDQHDASVDLRLADDETFHRAAELVETLAAHHGLSDVRLGQYSGELVTTVAVDRDYFDLVQFEMELENPLRARVRAMSAGAPGARPRGPRSRRSSAEVVPNSRRACDRQRALAFCWIAVGSALKDYAHIAKLPARQEPLSSSIRFRDRIAHQSLSPIDADVLRRGSTERVSGLRAILNVLRAAGQ